MTGVRDWRWVYRYDGCLLVSVTWLVMTGVRDWRWVYRYDGCLLVSVTWLVMTGVRDWRWVYRYDGCLLVSVDTWVSLNNASRFKTPMGLSFFCDVPISLTLGGARQGAVVTFNVMHLQPFLVKDGAFSEGRFDTLCISK